MLYKLINRPSKYIVLLCYLLLKKVMDKNRIRNRKFHDKKFKRF